MDQIMTCEGIGISGVPDDEGLRQLAAKGVRTLVDTRETAELAGAGMAAKATALGLGYVHIPISHKSLDKGQVERFRQVVLEAKNAPVHAFSTAGKRPLGILCFLACASTGESIIEIFRKAKKCGCCINKEYALKNYIYDFYRTNWPEILENHYRQPGPAKG
jgi:uncharacterized protein (TIGR01244 family)